jgi:hypothetical protein
MAMCVENGMFTVSFLKEGISKVRLTDLVHLRVQLTISSVDGSTSYCGHHGMHARIPTYLSKVQVQWEVSILPKHFEFPISERSLYVPPCTTLVSILTPRCHGPGLELIQ